MRKLFFIIALFWCSTAFAAWTVQPVKKSIEDGKLVVFAAYSPDGGDTSITKYHRVDTYEQFVEEAKKEISRLEALDAALAKVELGKILNTSTPPVQPIPPTQAELDRAAFLVLLRDWQQKKAVLGISVTVTQQDVDDAYTAMKTAYKEEYAPFLVGLI